MKKVLLIDSGSGGVNILKECVKVCPNCNYLLFCDTKNLPYGGKSKQQLLEITFENLDNIYKFFKFDIVVFACNTLTCTCLQECREKYKDIVFIGTVPAVKPALEKFKEEEILVLATEATIKHNVLINKYKALKTLSLPSFATEIDRNLDDLSVLKDNLTLWLQDYSVKAVVLGCTHYKAVADEIVNALGGEVEVFDSENGVARRLKSFISSDQENYQVQIMLSDNQEFLPILWNYFYKD